MKGFIATTILAGCLVAAGAGWDNYHDVVDPCYPQRYEYMARHEVLQAFAPQVQNGHILDQTVWNSAFEPGTERLTPGGLAKLESLARRRPCPDPTIYLEITHDGPVRYD